MECTRSVYYIIHSTASMRGKHVLGGIRDTVYMYIVHVHVHCTYILADREQVYTHVHYDSHDAIILHGFD